MLEKITYEISHGISKDVRMAIPELIHGWRMQKFFKLSCFVERDYDEFLDHEALTQRFIKELRFDGYAFLSTTPDDRMMIYDRDGLVSKFNYEYTFWVRKLSEAEIIQDRLGDLCG